MTQFKQEWQEDDTPILEAHGVTFDGDPVVDITQFQEWIEEWKQVDPNGTWGDAWIEDVKGTRYLVHADHGEEDDGSFTYFHVALDEYRGIEEASDLFVLKDWGFVQHPGMSVQDVLDELDKRTDGW